MTVHQINSVQDSTRIVDHYALTAWPFESGTARGFANWLFIGHLSVATEEMGARVDAYLEEFEESADTGHDLDAWLQSNADVAMQGHRYGEKACNAFMWAIRRIKEDEFGRATWEAIAELATSADQPKAIRQMDEHVASQALSSLRELAQMSSDIGVGHMPYFPSTGSRERFVRLGIERLDETLATHSVWQGGEPDWPVEVTAVMTLATGRLSALEESLARTMASV